MKKAPHENFHSKNPAFLSIPPGSGITSPYSSSLSLSSQFSPVANNMPVPPTPQDMPMSAADSIDSQMLADLPDLNEMPSALNDLAEPFGPGASDFDYFMFDLSPHNELSPELSNNDPSTLDTVSSLDSSAFASTTSLQTLKSVGKLPDSMAGSPQWLNSPPTGLGIAEKALPHRPSSRGPVADARSKVAGNPRITKKSSRTTLKSRRSKIGLSDDAPHMESAPATLSNPQVRSPGLIPQASMPSLKKVVAPPVATPTRRVSLPINNHTHLPPPTIGIASAAAAAALTTASGQAGGMAGQSMNATPIRGQEPQSSPSTILVRSNTVKPNKRNQASANVAPSPTPATRVQSTTKLVSEASDSSPAKGVFSQNKPRKEPNRRRSGASVIPEMYSAMTQFQVELNVSPSVASAQAALNSAQASKVANSLTSMAVPAAQAAQANKMHAARGPAKRQPAQPAPPQQQFYPPSGGTPLMTIPPNGHTQPPRPNGAQRARKQSSASSNSSHSSQNQPAMQQPQLQQQQVSVQQQQQQGRTQVPPSPQNHPQHQNWMMTMNERRQGAPPPNYFPSAAGTAAMFPGGLPNQQQRHQQPQPSHSQPVQYMQGRPQGGRAYNQMMGQFAAGRAPAAASAASASQQQQQAAHMSQLQMATQMAGQRRNGFSAKLAAPDPPEDFRNNSPPIGLRGVDVVGSPLFSPPPVPRSASANVSPVPSRSDSLQSAQSIQSSGDEPLWLVMDQGHMEATNGGSRNARSPLRHHHQAADMPKKQLIVAQGMDDFKIDWNEGGMDLGDQWDMMGFLKPEYDVGYSGNIDN